MHGQTDRSYSARQRQTDHTQSITAAVQLEPVLVQQNERLDRLRQSDTNGDAWADRQIILSTAKTDRSHGSVSHSSRTARGMQT